ncbi:MBL fold metallo-hydrolase [bacterium]|nr:MBL fold metallo-hydrolase [bacterium]
MKRFICSLLVILLGCTCSGWSQKQETARTYVCIPCGCIRDGEIFTKQGMCPSCGMYVVDKETGIAPPLEPKKIADGVYVIHHNAAATGFPQGNTTVIVGEREVLVVDACFLPSTAREDIAKIKTWTDKPVRYLVNTHWHYDHTWGNSTYAAAFPSIGIIAHKVTLEEMEGFNKEWLIRYPNDLKKLKQKVESGKDENGNPLKEDAIKAIKNDIAAREKVVAEFVNFTDRLPNLSFETELNINLGNREVQIKHMGLGNTAGDAVIFLPKEKILITGDILVYPTPYLCSGYPSEWNGTLQRMAALGPVQIVPGHGEILNDMSYLNQIVRLLTTTVSEVRRVFYKLGNGAQLEDVQKTMDLAAIRKEFAGDDKYLGDFFDRTVQGCLIRDAFYEVKLR